MFEIIFAKLLVTHILAVMVAVGTVTVTDYLHILGLRDPKLERRTLFVFPLLSKLIIIALTIIYVTGALLVLAKPSVLENPLFYLKTFLVILVTINGVILHRYIFPKIEKGIKKKKYPDKLLKQAAFAGSLSIVSWYGIVVLAITKDLGYSVLQFSVGYLISLFIAYSVAIRLEKFKRKEQNFSF